MFGPVSSFAFPSLPKSISFATYWDPAGSACSTIMFRPSRTQNCRSSMLSLKLGRQNLSRFATKPRLTRQSSWANPLRPTKNDRKIATFDSRKDDLQFLRIVYKNRGITHLIKGIILWNRDKFRLFIVISVILSPYGIILQERLWGQ